MQADLLRQRVSRHLSSRPRHNQLGVLFSSASILSIRSTDLSTRLPDTRNSSARNSKPSTTPRQSPRSLRSQRARALSAASSSEPPSVVKTGTGGTHRAAQQHLPQAVEGRRGVRVPRCSRSSDPTTRPLFGTALRGRRPRLRRDGSLTRLQVSGLLCPPGMLDLRHQFGGFGPCVDLESGACCEEAGLCPVPDVFEGRPVTAG